LFNWESLRVASGVTIDSIKQKPETRTIGHLQPVEMESDLSGNTLHWPSSINALERDDMFFYHQQRRTRRRAEWTDQAANESLETYLKAGT